jgi:hypothetical protein
MDKQEALNLLDQAASQLQASREVHYKLQQAVELLRMEINPPKEEKQEETILNPYTKEYSKE